MATIIALKRRIQAAQNVSKTTRAMQMIAASKLKKAQNAALSVRPYVERLNLLTQEVSAGVGEEFTHPYLMPTKIVGKTLLIALSPDKGLCGGLITNLLKEFLSFKDREQNVEYVLIGKKIERQAARLGSEIIASFEFGNTVPAFDTVFPIEKIIDDYYLNGKVDNVKILSAHFASFFTQTPKITTVLPITLPEENKQELNFHLFEPNAKDVMPSILKHYLEMMIYQNLLESYLSEQASRMISMQNATSNANDIIEDLKLEYNKTRQAKITNEILDISSASIILNE